MKPITRASPLLAALLAAAVPACDTNVGEADQPGAHTTRVSEKLDGTETNAKCEYPSISGDGRFVTFTSLGTTLVPNDANNISDIFIKDRATGTFENITLLSTGEFGPYPRENGQSVISADGRYVAFESYGVYIAAFMSNSQPIMNIWRYDRLTRSFNPVVNIFDWPDASLQNPSISADGRFITFESSATNLVPGITPTRTQVWVADFQNVTDWNDVPTLTLVSRALTGPTVPADSACSFPQISGNGGVIVFQSDATNLHAASTGSRDIYLGTPAGSPVEFVSWAAPGVRLDGAVAYPSVSYSGDYVAFCAGGVSNPSLPFSGVFRYNRVTATLEVVADETVNSGMAVEPVDRTAISADGQVVAYTSAGAGETFVIRARDMSAASATTASVHISGALPQLTCERPVLSADGKWVIWQTQAANLVLGDTNGFKDIYVRGPLR